MSLVDFDDDTSFHSTSAPAASFNGHASIDDPFGFNVFGGGSSGTKQTTTVTETVFAGNNDAFFDDFDPLAGFGDASEKPGSTHTTRVVTTTTTVSGNQSKGDDGFDPFGDLALNGSGGANQVTLVETTKQSSWVVDDLDASDRNDATSHDHDHDLDHSGSSPQMIEVVDEKSKVVAPQPSVVVDSTDDLFWTSQATSLDPTTAEQDTPASPHSDGVFPHSSTDAIDEILGDLHEETAPRAEMEDLSPVKLMEDRTSPDRFGPSANPQFNFDGLNENRSGTAVEAVKPGDELGMEVDASSTDVFAFGDNLNNASTKMEDAVKSEMNDGQKDGFAVGFEAVNSEKISSQMKADGFNMQSDFDIKASVAGGDPLSTGTSPSGVVSSPSNVNEQENFDFNTDVTSNPSFCGGSEFPSESSPADFNALIEKISEFSAHSTSNPFAAGNIIPREDSLNDFNARGSIELNAGAASDPFLSGDSVPREGSPSVKNDVEEREILRKLAEEVRIEEHVSDQNTPTKGAITDVNAASSMASNSRASTKTFPNQPEVDFRRKESVQKAASATVPETVYNKMYNYRQDNSWKHKEMDVEDTSPVQFQLNNKKTEKPEVNVQSNYKKAEVEEEDEDEDDSQRSDQFFEDVKDRSRSRISIEEIRQRSYEDFGPVSSPHSQSRKEQKPAEKTPVVYVLGAAGDNVCKVCAKRVYEMEKVTADLQVYHKTCFRCHHCNRVLSLGNFSTNDGRLYCKPHFIEIFKTKGNYKDSFALAEQQKQRGDNGRGDDASSQDQDEMDNSQRHRRTSGGYQDDDDRDYDDYEEEEARQRTLREEIPAVPIKSVRSIFEKMSQDVAPPVHQQQKKTTTTTTKAISTAYVEPARRPEPEVTKAERVRNDSEKSDLEIDRHRLLERRDSTSEVVQSSTTCIVEDELPPPAFTRSLLAKFKMMEDSHGETTKTNKAPVVYGAPVAKQTAQTAAPRHQPLSSHSSGDSRASNDPVAHEEVVKVGRDAPDSIVRSTSQDRKEEERTDELPQAGLAKSLLAQWRNLEEQSKRGRSREPRASSSARRSQSMSRVETVQRARLYPVASAPRSKQVEDIRPDAYSDQEDDVPAGVPTKQRLAVFQGLDYGAGSDAKPKRTFKWEVKESLPMNRGVLIVHGDVPRKPNPEEAAAASASAARWSDSVNEYAATGPEPRGNRRSTTDDDDNFEASNQVPDDVVHSTTTTVIIEEELPAPATTRTLLQHFKSMEDVTKAPPRPRVAPAHAANRDSTPKMKQAATYVDDDDDSERRTHQSSSVNGDEHDYGASPDAGEFGNDPVRDPSVIREADRCDEEELPAQGTTKSLLAKFQSFQGKR